MRIAIVGGSLQGIESVYLAKKAGYTAVVIDKMNSAPAFSMADESFVLDLTEQESDAMRIFRGCDAVLPACEDISVLIKLDEMLSRSKIPLLFDADAYKISSSKNASNNMMERIGVPMPRKWQQCGYPLVVKPSSQSGSTGVTVANDRDETDEGIRKIMKIGDEPVIQEFVKGKNVSIEVIGNGNEFISFVTTEMQMSGNYDCKRVRCLPGILTREKEDEFRKVAEAVAQSIDLGALMDVEAVDTEKGLKVLEIDACIPTQTPAAVLAATGINLLEELVNSRFGGTAGERENRVSSYEHFIIDHGKMAACGENEFAAVRSPAMVRRLFGADEMITDFEDGADIWRCAMINSAGSEEELEKKRARCIRTIMDECKIDEFLDTHPKEL